MKRQAVQKRVVKSAEKQAAAIVVFALREPLRKLVTARQEKAKTLALTVRPAYIQPTIIRDPEQQDAVSKLISETPSVMLFLEFLISQAAQHQGVSRSKFYSATVEEVCILIEGYQEGLRQDLDVGEHILGIPNDEKEAQDLWERLSEEDYVPSKKGAAN